MMLTWEQSTILELVESHGQHTVSFISKLLGWTGETPWKGNSGLPGPNKKAGCHSHTWCTQEVLSVGLLVAPLGVRILGAVENSISYTPILWPSDAKSWFTGKDPAAGKDGRQEERGAMENEMVGWHHWLDGHEFEQTPGDSEGQGSRARRSPRGCKELDMTYQLNSNNKTKGLVFSWFSLTRSQVISLRHLPGSTGILLESRLTHGVHQTDSQCPRCPRGNLTNKSLCSAKFCA